MTAARNKVKNAFQKVTPSRIDVTMPPLLNTRGVATASAEGEAKLPATLAMVMIGPPAERGRKQGDRPEEFNSKESQVEYADCRKRSIPGTYQGKVHGVDDNSDRTVPPYRNDFFEKEKEKGRLRMN